MCYPLVIRSCLHCRKVANGYCKLTHPLHCAHPCQFTELRSFMIDTWPIVDGVFHILLHTSPPPTYIHKTPCSYTSNSVFFKHLTWALSPMCALVQSVTAHNRQNNSKLVVLHTVGFQRDPRGMHVLQTSAHVSFCIMYLYGFSTGLSLNRASIRSHVHVDLHV